MVNKNFFVIIVRSRTLYLLGIIFFFLVGWALMLQQVINTNANLAAKVSGKKIVVDPGHGGNDPGAKSYLGLREKKINLEVALKLKKYLSQVGIYCLLTREDDRDFCEATIQYLASKRHDLSYRAKIANDYQADLFISIHANSFPSPKYHGAQTFFDTKNSESKKLAQTIQKQLIMQLGKNKRHIKPGNFRVLQEVQMPAVMVEIGFLSNPEEAALLADSNYCDRIAQAIYAGIINYLAKA